MKEGAARNAEMVAKILGENPAEAKTIKPTTIATDIDCDECGKPMVIRQGRRGYFLGCSGYPKCKNTGEVPGKLVEEMGLDNKARTAGATPPASEPLEEEDAA